MMKMKNPYNSVPFDIQVENIQTQNRRIAYVD